jgi:hypothetical protein
MQNKDKLPMLRVTLIGALWTCVGILMLPNPHSTAYVNAWIQRRSGSCHVQRSELCCLSSPALMSWTYIFVQGPGTISSLP